jgi:cytochrome c5
MNQIVSRAAIGFGAAILALGVGVTATQMPPDPTFPGSKMTRQQVLDKVTSESPGTTASVAKGKELYEKLCAGCHIFGETGTSVGPDLTTLSSRFRKRDTLESIMWPSKTISTSIVTVSSDRRHA